MLTSREIRSRFLAFFEKRGHAILPSASLVPLNDPSVLFNTAGMQPLVPYLLGEPHPKGKRLANAQKCVRTQDIDEVGDNTHDTFFEMLGNWSLGDYFKKDAIQWSYEFLTSKDEGLGLDPARLYVTVFGGNNDAPKDNEAFEIWRTLVPEHRIYFMTASASGKEPNWWSAGDSGPCGPDSEMFYDVTEKGLGDLTKEAYMQADDRQEVVEIWNDVFMEYVKKDGKVTGKLSAQNVDTGAGLERLCMVLQRTNNVFATDLFRPAMDVIRRSSVNYSERSARIVADHIRTAMFMISDGVVPSNSDQGYILRRLVRRAVRHADAIGLSGGFTAIIDAFLACYEGVYERLFSQEMSIKEEIRGEEERFRKTLSDGMKEFERHAGDGVISGADAFTLFTTYGFPIELTKELAEERKIETRDLAEYDTLMKKHQELSRAGAVQKFAGGLADHSRDTVRLHTAHHLLLRALQIVLGPDVHQRGSNITSERLRIDFSYGAKLTDEQKRAVEEIVNQKIAEDLPVIRTELSRDEAEKLGAEHEFGAKYPDRVSVYSVGPKEATDTNPQFGKHFSIEFCGGPHVKRTGELRAFHILKEEAVAQGVRRIKATIAGEGE